MSCPRILRRSCVAGALLLGLAAGAQATTVYRCEDARGRITYADAPCPSDARKARPVDDSPPVLTRDAKGAARAEASPAPGRIETTRAPERASPLEIDRRLTDDLRAQIRECELQLRRLQFLQQDVDATTGAARSSAELALRRAQDDYRNRCPRQ